MNDTFNFPLPFLVVITKAPLPASEPYKADAFAPFNTVIFSISSELSLSIASLEEG